MTKEAIIKKLGDNWVSPDRGWRELSRAKEIICPKDEVINEVERAYRMSVISEYLNIKTIFVTA